MEIVKLLFKTLFNMVFIAYCSIIVFILLTILMPDSVLKAIEILKGLIS